MSRITLTIHLDFPDGVAMTPDVTYGAAPPSAPHAPASGTSSPAPGQPFSGLPPKAVMAAAAWVCPEHGAEKVKHWPDGGISCGVKGGSNTNEKGYCRYRWTAPKPGRGAADPPPPQGEYEDLPWQ